jgi:hypothetical protein
MQISALNFHDVEILFSTDVQIFVTLLCISFSFKDAVPSKLPLFAPQAAADPPQLFSRSGATSMLK